MIHAAYFARTEFSSSHWWHALPWILLSSCVFYMQGMGLWTFLEGLLLFANAFAILNEERFLAPRGWSMSEIMAGGRRRSMKDQVIGLIYAAQYMRIPLIILNAVTITVKLLTGWVFRCQALCLLLYYAVFVSVYQYLKIRPMKKIQASHCS